MSSTAQHLSPTTLDQGLGDWLSGATCDDILFGNGAGLAPEDFAGLCALINCAHAVTILWSCSCLGMLK